jgi:hypothetical protein
MTELSSMPHGNGAPRIVRVRSKIYAFQVGHNTLCYDLDQLKWVETSLPPAPGDFLDYTSVIVLPDGHLLAAGYTSARSIAVVKLNLATGQWTRLSNLPHHEWPCQSFFSANRDGMLVAFDRGYWTSMQAIEGEVWEEQPDLRGAGLRAFWLDKMSSEVKIFSGNGWVDLPSVEINGKELTLSNSIM